MILYLTIIVVAMILIISLNTMFNGMFSGLSPLWTICVVFFGVVLEIVIDGVFAFIIHSLPNKWFNKDKKCFDVSRRERKFYEKLNIKHWKDKVWELGALGGFRKNKLNDPNNTKYIETFIVENNKGCVVHLVGIVFGFLILLFPLPKYWFCIGLPIAIVNVYLNLLSMMVLRYNIPKLKIAYLRALKVSEAQNKQNDNKCVEETTTNNEKQ